MTRRFIEYARVSKVGERGDDLVSPELQIADMDGYAARNDILVVDRIVDLDESGRSFERRAVDGVLVRIERGEADGVLLFKWSRWGRNLLQSKIYLARVEAAGGDVRASSEDFDPATTMGKFTRDQMLLIAELQSNQISDGWKAVQARRVALGLTPGGAAPIGYRSAGRGQPFVPDEVLGPLVRKMYEDYLRGRGPQSIAKELNDAGHRTTPSRRGGVKEPEGRPFSVMTVTRVLDSAFNAGYVTVDVRRGAPRHVQGAHQPLIDEATWVAYRRERDRRRVRHPKDRQPRWHLGAGLTTCGLCGTNLMVNSYADPNGQALCSAYKNSRTCAGVWINRQKLETLVALWLGGRIDEWADRTDELTGADDERDRLAKELDAARADEDRLVRGRREAARLLALGDVDEDDYRAAVRDADARRAEVAERIVGVQAQLDALSPGADVYDRLARGAEGMTSDEWSVVLRRIVRRIAVAPAEITLTPWRGEPTVWDRSLITPRRPAREHETPRGADGKFLRSSAD